MTDEEFRNIMLNLNAHGFADALAKVQMDCIKKIAMVCIHYGADSCEVFRIFGNNMINLADDIEQRAEGATEEDE